MFIYSYHGKRTDKFQPEPEAIENPISLNSTEDLNDLTYKIIGCAYKVHGQLGPGLLESSYETCLEYELMSQGLTTLRQLALPLVYDRIKLDAGY